MRFYFAMWRTNWYTRLTLSSGISDTIFSISFSNFSFGVILHHPPSLCLTQSVRFSRGWECCSLVYNYRTLVLFKQYVLSPNCGSLFSIC
nr:MAG TPA: hypothetical protein [Caudoviricetes sp.]